MDRARVGWRLAHQLQGLSRQPPGRAESAAIGTSKSTDATVAGLTNGTLYYFMVTAVNAAGNESPFSAEVSAEPTGLTPVVPLPSPGPPKWLITLLAAAAAMAVAGALTLITRRGALPLTESLLIRRVPASRSDMARTCGPCRTPPGRTW